MHDLPLLVNIAVALSAALVGGLIARRAGVPPLVGYLLAGVAIGPFTPGFVGDIAAISQLAELGVVFLMFGVGLHFSLRDLWRVRAVAVPGALGQMALATLLAYGLARFWGWSTEASLVLGLAISVASTVVLLRGLMDDGLLNTAPGRLAVGWLVLEDLATVLLLLVLPALAPSGAGFDPRVLGLTLAKAAAFIALMLVLGARVVPYVLLRVARTRSRELFLLVALTVALGTALGSAALFGVSLALGAFLAGVVVSESPLSHQVGADVLPVPRGLRRALLRVRRHARGSRLSRRPGRARARSHRPHRLRQGPARVRPQHRPGPAAAHGAGGGRRPQPDRRVLVHPRTGGSQAEDARRAISIPSSWRVRCCRSP